VGKALGNSMDVKAAEKITMDVFNKW